MKREEKKALRLASKLKQREEKKEERREARAWFAMIKKLEKKNALIYEN